MPPLPICAPVFVYTQPMIGLPHWNRRKMASFRPQTTTISAYQFFYIYMPHILYAFLFLISCAGKQKPEILYGGCWDDFYASVLTLHRPNSSMNNTSFCKGENAFPCVPPGPYTFNIVKHYIVSCLAYSVRLFML